MSRGKRCRGSSASVLFAHSMVASYGRSKRRPSRTKPLSESIRHGDEAVARAHVVLDYFEKRLGNRPRLAVANRLRVPLNDRRNLHGAAQEQHLACGARLVHRDVADADAL